MIMNWRMLATSLVSTLVLFCLCAPTASAIPQFARMTGSDCTSCHVVAPMLNERGLAFVERGYRLPEHLQDREQFTVPLSLWLTGRIQEQPDTEELRAFVNKVEAVSGGPIGELPLAYFLEWRIVSLDMNGDGTFHDRSGRFEDVALMWDVVDGHEVRVGQYRAIQQNDVSLRLSLSEPSVLSASLPGRPDDDGRRHSVRAFSPAGRSPSVGYTWHSIGGESPADGLFHGLTLAFPGEFSIPLTSEARENASFEFEARPKGLFAETFYRQGLSSLGVHGFAGDAQRWMATVLGAFNYQDFLVTGAVGRDSGAGNGGRWRSSIEGQYMVQAFPRVRGLVGFRAEHLSNTESSISYIPFLAIAGPNLSYGTVLLQAQYRVQGDAQAFFIDTSTIF